MTSKHNRKVSIVEDIDGSKTVFIHDALFRGRCLIDWKFVEEYLKEYIGESFEIIEYNEQIYIGKDLPDEYCGSKYTENLKRGFEKAKANAIIGIPEMINVATDVSFLPNMKRQHSSRAKNGWYRYKTRFALPVYKDNGELAYYNIWEATLIVNNSSNGNKYLYDIINLNKQ